MPLAVCRYEKLGAGGMEQAMAVYPRHTAYVREFSASGELLLIGTFADPVADGSMAVFLNREAAQRFIEKDPFVTEGVVVEWTILDWNAQAYRAELTDLV
ncbi:MAG TPA: YciI family protein [Pseudolysinimonas sp.]|jgi:hypothetical protein